MSLQTAPTLSYSSPTSTAAAPDTLRAGDILASAFAITVAVWLTAYLCRMPRVNAPGQVTVLTMLGMVFLGGLLTARYSQKAAVGALLAGALSGLLDILIVGSVYHDLNKSDPTAPSAALWILGSILTSALVAGAGGLIGARLPSPARPHIRWTQIFGIVLAAATLPLITAGGLVTAFRAGLAVPDWPQSYGYNMFLFPLSKMQSAQGNFYEHAHRLMGSLVGTTALALAIYVSLSKKRAAVVAFAWAIGICIAIQAVLGGLRVTEKSTPLAIAHGIFAQLVFASMAAFAALSSRSYTDLPPASKPAASTDRVLSFLLLFLLIVQLAFGAFVRHTNALIMAHISLASLITLLILACSFRAWGLHGNLRPIRNTGLFLAALVLLQLTLGIIALVFRAAPGEEPTLQSAFLTTAHQANGALLLAAATLYFTWTNRLLKSPHETAPHPVTPHIHSAPA